MNLDKLIKDLELNFNDHELLKRSLTHRSLLNEKKNKNLKHNERLEFLGDAVLELIISEYLFHKYPDRPEGELTSFRAAIVNTSSLAEVSQKLEIGEHLLMSKGEEMTGGREKEYLLANALEAVLGAIYLDQGYDAAKIFVIKHLTPKIEDIVKYRLDIDPKTKLQERSQRILKRTPSYKVIGEEGPDHEKIFTVVVKMNGKIYGKGEGANKQKAEENAAIEALEKLENPS
jgi:ribonuclease III